MNKAIFSKIAILILMLSSSGLVACSQNDLSTVRTASNGGTGGNGSAGGGGGFPTSCSSTTVGKIYDPAGGGSTAFEQQVKSFVSATLNPTLLGSVSGDINAATGIDLKGSWSFDSSGSLVLAGAAVSIEIFDSYVGTTDSAGETILPYTIDFSSAASGSLNRTTGQFTVVFRDSYGSITFTGTKGSTYSEGTVTFANTTAVSGYSPASGTLGSFKINNCALIK